MTSQGDLSVKRKGPPLTLPRKPVRKPVRTPLRSVLLSYSIQTAVHCVLLTLGLVDVAHLGAHADNLWQLNLVRQLRENPRFAVNFVDANRIFPDLLVASGLERAWHLVGSTLSGSTFVMCLLSLNVMLLFLVSIGISRNFGHPASIAASLLVLVLFSTNEFFLEILRPGYHTTGSLLALIWLLWRLIPAKHMSLLDVVFLGSLAFSSRLFLPMLLAPCFLVTLANATRKERLRSTFPFVVAALYAVIFWALLPLIPNVFVAVFDSTLHVKELVSLPIDFATNTSTQPVRLSVHFMTFYWLITAVAIGTTVFRLRQHRLRNLQTAAGRLQAVFLISLILGAVSMRLVDYVVEGRMYVLILPIVLATLVVGCEAQLLFAQSADGSQKREFLTLRLGFASALACALAIPNLVTLATAKPRLRYPGVEALLAKSQVLDKPGLGDYWSAYQLSVADKRITVRTISTDASPVGWVDNPWEMFRTPGSSSINLDLRYSWILAQRPSDPTLSQSAVTAQTVPTLAQVTKIFGPPSRTEVGSADSFGSTPVLYVYDQGTEMATFKKYWAIHMTLRKIDPRELGPAS